MDPIITFDESTAETVLESFDRRIDDDGRVLRPDGEPETTDDGVELTIEKFAGVERGSLIFLDDDFNTLVGHVERRRKR